VATPPTPEELEALELARRRLEAVLSGDENWRALRQAGAEDADPAARPARQARNTRLEMALAGNAHYQAWKHLNGAIDALRARSAGQAALLEDVAPGADKDKVVARGADGPAASASMSASPRLAERLGGLEAPPLAAIALGGEDQRRDPRPVGRKDRRGPAARGAAPEEASVTFVVRERQAASMPSAEPSSGSGSQSWGEPSAASLQSPGDGDARGEATAPHFGAASEEAEVAIISAEGRRQAREADQRAGHVRRFRRALSGD